jgi:hypothetical protein
LIFYHHFAVTLRPVVWDSLHKAANNWQLS